MSATHTSIHRARVIWDAVGDDARAHTVELAGQRLAASSAVEFGGDPDRADPEEMFVALDRDLDDKQVDSLHHRAHERCFIANSVSCPVEVEPRK